MKRLAIAFLLLCLVGCGNVVDSIVGIQKADFQIIDRETGIKSYGSAYVTLLIENRGDMTGYNVSCDVVAKKNDIIIGSAFVYFAGGNPIAPGEKAQSEGVFFGLHSLDNISLEYKLEWLE